MRIRDEKRRAKQKQLERTGKICKQEIEKINQPLMSGNPDVAELQIWTIERLFKGRFKVPWRHAEFFRITAPTL